MSQGPRIRVLVVEDSLVVRELLDYMINNDPRLEVAASVDTAEKALEFLKENAVDVISMDIHLPGMNGMEATRRIMATWPTPIVIVSITTRTRDAQFTMEALKAGALSVVEKPVGASHERFAAMAERLCTQLAAMSQVKVVRQRFSDSMEPAEEAMPLPLAPLPAESRPGPGRAPRCLGIVASTGGPKAISQILTQLGPGFPVPILLVQHMTPTFLAPFVEWLDQTTPFTVQFAKDGEVPLPGHVYHAPADRHLELRGRKLAVNQGAAPVTVHRPSGDVLFASMALHYGADAVGVLLTGMGSDGALGLLELAQCGAHTIAEDQSTAVVYGMPGAARKLGAVREDLPLGDIAGRLRQLVLETETAGK